MRTGMITVMDYTTPKLGKSLPLPVEGVVSLIRCMFVTNSCRWLAYTLVCVNVLLTGRARVCHIFQVINQTGNQAASQITPYKEAEEAEECIHETDVMRDAGDDGLLTVWTDGLHWCGLEHFSLQHSNSGGCSWRGQHCGCVAPHGNEGTRAWTHLSRHRVRVMARRRRVVDTLGRRHWHWHWHGHCSFSRNMRREEPMLRSFIWWRAIIWRWRMALLWLSCSYGLSILFFNKWCTGSSGVWRRRIT